VLDSVTLLLRSDCTLRCPYCYQQPGGAARMSWRVLHASLDLLVRSSRGPLALEFSGGEALLAFPMIVRAVRHLERLGEAHRVRFSLTTNGTLLDEEKLAFLDERGFSMRVSLHSVPHARTSRGRSQFLRFDRLLDRVRADHPGLWRQRFGVIVTVGVAELRSFADSIEYLLGKDVRRIGVAPAFGEDGWDVGDIVEIKRQFSKVTRLVRRHRAETGRVPVLLYDRRPGSARGADLLCGGASGRAIAVDPTRRAYACSVMAGARPRITPSPLNLDAGSPLWVFDLGDVGTPGLRRRAEGLLPAVLRSGIFRQRRKQHSSYARCATCPALRECSVCPVSCAFGTGDGDPRKVSDFVCAFNRVGFDEVRRFQKEPVPSPRALTPSRRATLLRELRLAAKEYSA
jgi:sulfatase maturation enzyme AslB (radical SAM superfamily)